MNQKKIENEFYAAAPGKKGTMARNSEFDTDEVKNILHKESRDAEWGIDREAKGRGLYTYSAYHAYIGESVFTKRFNTRGEAERWLEKQNAAGHPNKRKLARPGTKATFNAASKAVYAELWSFWTDAKQKNPEAHIADLKRLIAKARSMPNYTPLGYGGSRQSLHKLADQQEMQAEHYFSRPGTKAKMANAAAWTNSDDREADRVIRAMKELDGKCSKKRAEIFDIESKIIPRVIAITNAAKQKKDTNFLATASHAAAQADNVRYSFARSGTKSKFAWQPEINNAIRKVNATIDNSQARLREAAKQGLWATSASICKGIGAMYSGNGGLVTLYEELQNAADKERRSK